jgi:hypothetical protein
MIWSYPKNKLEQGLSVFLNKHITSCSRKPSGPESARLHSVADFIAELDSGIRLEGFTTSKIEEPSGGSRQSTIYYSITCDALPASECFVRIEPGRGPGAATQFYARIYDAITYHYKFINDDNFGFVYRFLEKFENIAAELPAVRAKFEKREKITELTQNSIAVWCSQICEDLGYPYMIKEGSIRSILFVKLDEKTQLEIIIPHRNFQEVMTELPVLIKTYHELLESSKARVLITNCAPKSSWRGDPSKKNKKR